MGNPTVILGILENSLAASSTRLRISSKVDWPRLTLIRGRNISESSRTGRADRHEGAQTALSQYW
ncbi:hypothetical protein D9M71_817970 [compost metagenome]